MFDVVQVSRHKTPWHLRVLYISTLLLRTAFGALLLLISAFVTGDPGTRLLSVAIIAVPYPLAEMLTANYFGMVSDRVGRKRVIVLGTTLAAIMVAFYSLSNNTWYLAVLHGIHGVGAAATVAPAIAMIADHAHSSDRGRQMGWFDYSTFLGYILGAVVGGFLVDLIDIRLAFLLMAGMLAASAIMLYALVKVEPVRAKAERYVSFAALRKVFKVREVRLMFPIWLIVATVLGLALTYLPIILLSQNISGSSIGLMFAGGGVVLGLLQPFWGKVSDRFGRVPVMAYGVFSMLGIIVMLVFFSDFLYYQDAAGFHLKILGLIPLGILGLGSGAFVPSALALMADASDSRSYGATMGLYSFALGFGAFIAESLGLVIILATGKESAPAWILYFAAGLIGLAVILMIAFFLRTAIAKRLRPGRT
ncbi:MAG TPA: MFS transporter [Methanomassiliicoccales archaeon]|nr:MFS transporter [Methanomassiliicoccales archaeon]